jgi:hypothetical protein
MVRIRFPPAQSHVRTCFQTQVEPDCMLDDNRRKPVTTV